MKIGILGKKLGMTRVYDTNGTIRPVTAILAEPNTVLAIRTKENEGYAAIQVGAFDQKMQRASKPIIGHCKKSNSAPKKFIREFYIDPNDDLDKVDIGSQLKVDRFKVGMRIDVIGQTKGKGFQGVVKKHNFSGQPAAHGSKMHRRNGAIGERSTPGRVFKNHGMPGHMGDERKTVQNLEVIQVRTEDNIILVAGAIPGAKGSHVIIRPAIKGQPRPKIQPAKAKKADTKANKK
jgi:large subunit ribosomal protein L3